MDTSAALTQALRDISTNALEARQRYPLGGGMPFICGFNEVSPTSQTEQTFQGAESEMRMQSEHQLEARIAHVSHPQILPESGLGEHAAFAILPFARFH